MTFIKNKGDDFISDPTIKITEFDKETYDATAQVLKAAIPYADHTIGKFMAVYAKFLELKKILAYFEQPESRLQICSVPGQKPTPEEMLSDLKKYSEPSQAEMIDRMLNILQMTKFIEKYKELEKSPEFARMMNMMNNFAQTQPAASGGTSFGNTSASAQTPNTAANLAHALNALSSSDSTSGMDTTKMPDASVIANLMNQMKQPGGMEQLKNMLTPEQRQMYETLVAMNQQN